MNQNSRYTIFQDRNSKFAKSKDKENYSLTAQKKPILGPENKTYFNLDRHDIPGYLTYIGEVQEFKPISPGLLLTFDTLANAETLIGGSVTDVNNWNTFFSTSTFESVQLVRGDVISLKGGKNVVIESQLFKDYSHLKSIHDSDYAITTVEQEAFLNCSGLEELNLLNCYTINGNGTNGTFQDCSSLKNVILPNCTDFSGSYNFKNCNSLEQIVLFDLDVNTNQSTFSGVTGNTIEILTTSNFISGSDGTQLRNNNTVTFYQGSSIGAYPSPNTSILFIFNEQGDIYPSVPGISGSIANNDYTSVESFLGSEGFSQWNIRTAKIFSNILAIFPDNYAYDYLKLNDEIFENANIVGLKDYAKENSNILYSGYIRYIGNKTFKNSNIRYARALSLIEIGNEAFFNCSYFKPSINFKFIDRIGDFAFKDLGRQIGNISLTMAQNNSSTFGSIAPGLAYMGTGSFSGSGIDSVIIGSVATSSNLWTPATAIGPASFKDSTVSEFSYVYGNIIGDSCFENCTNLTKLYFNYGNFLGSSIQNNNVFSGITGNNINLYISEGFYYCNSGNPDGDISYLISNNTVTASYSTGYIKYSDGFSGFPLSGLRISFNSPENLENFFDGDLSIDNINVKLKISGSAIPFKSVNRYNANVGILLWNGGGISISSSLFANTGIVQFEDRDYSVVNVGKDAFNGCTYLRSAMVGTAVNFGERAFKDCVNLSNVDLRSMHIVSASAFENCTSLTTLYSRDLVFAGDNAFKNTISASYIDFPALATMGNQCFSGSNNISFLNVPSLVTVGSTTGNNEVFSVTGNNIALTITGSLLTEGDISYLVSNNTVTLDYPSLILTFDSGSSVQAIVANTASVSDWNTFFNLPTYGTPFTSVQITEQVPLYENVTAEYPQDYGCQVKLYGGKNMTISPSRFQNYRKLRKLIDNGSTVVRVASQAFRQNSQFWWANSGYASNVYGIMEISLPGCTILETLAFFGNFETRRLNLPNLQTALPGSNLFSVMAWPGSFQGYSPPRPNYDNFEDQIVTLPNLTSTGTGLLANAFQIRSVNFPKQTLIPTFTFAINGGANSINIPEATGMNNQALWQLANYDVHVNMPKMFNLGETVGFNNLWASNQQAYYGTYRFPVRLMTVSGSGFPDGDIQAMVGNVRKIIV